MQFFHGSDKATLEYSPWEGESDEVDMLFASAAIDVAECYGDNVFSVKLTRPLESIPRISVRHWLLGEGLPEGTLIIEGEDDNDDFPVDTLVLRSKLDASIDPNPLFSIRRPALVAA